MKFKAGDMVKDERGESFKIVKLAEEGEVVLGPWFAGSKEIEIPVKAYVLEDEQGRWMYHRLQLEGFLSLATPEPLKEKLVAQLKESRETVKRLEKELEEAKDAAIKIEDELIELEKAESEFKADDIVRYKDHWNFYRVVKLVEERETIEGPWFAGSKEIEIDKDSIILEDSLGRWFCDSINSEGEEFGPELELIWRMNK
jgi:hypothetical protein